MSTSASPASECAPPTSTAEITTTTCPPPPRRASPALFMPNIIVKLACLRMKVRFEFVLRELFESDPKTRELTRGNGIAFALSESRKEPELILMTHPNPSTFLDRLHSDCRVLSRYISNVYLCNDVLDSWDVEGLADYVAARASAADDVICIRSRPRERFLEIGSALTARGFRCVPRLADATKSLHAVYAFGRRICVSISPAEHMSAPSTAMATEDATLPFVVSRAIYKIREGLWTIKFLETINSMNAKKEGEKEDAEAVDAARIADAYVLGACPACGASIRGEDGKASGTEHHCRGIDIGASPGGWSYYLASRGLSVCAVDPGALHIYDSPCIHTIAAVTAHHEAQNVLKMQKKPYQNTAEREAEAAAIVARADALGPCGCEPHLCPRAGAKKYSPLVRHLAMKSDEATALLVSEGEKPFNIVVCDVNLDPREAVVEILRLVRHGLVADGALLILTLKEIASGKANIFGKQCSTVLEPFFDVLGVRRLLANGQEETLLARCRMPGGGGASLEEMVDAQIAKAVAFRVAAYSKYGTDAQKKAVGAEVVEKNEEQ